jgi:tyrosinase
VRKNAESLTDAERDRFLDALGRLNDQGFGLFQQYRAMHTDDTSMEAHGRAGFLPWHRAYLLDLERELQALDPSVALPYWRFDEPAPRLFTTGFLGVSDASGRVQVDPANPLRLWTTDNQVGIVRLPWFDPAVSGAGREFFPGFFQPVLDEPGTLGLGDDYAEFLDMEGDPHGAAHVSFQGFVSDIDTAAKDPLFFLLHANVDRLWAKWQWRNRRFDPASAAAYPFLGAAGDPGSTRIGHNRDDSMWPWNQVTGGPRPGTAPGGRFPAAPAFAAPGLEPAVGSMIPYQGNADPDLRLGFDYDDVPWEA